VPLHFTARYSVCVHTTHTHTHTNKHYHARIYSHSLQWCSPKICSGITNSKTSRATSRRFAFSVSHSFQKARNFTEISQQVLSLLSGTQSFHKYGCPYLGALLALYIYDSITRFHCSHCCTLFMYLFYLHCVTNKIGFDWIGITPQTF